jgi:hypothetical protein
MKKKRKGKGNKSPEPRDDENTLAGQRDLLINAWHSRHELYKNLFGEHASASPENYGPPLAIAENTASLPEKSGDDLDPSFADQRLAVLGYSPDPLRPYWTYITAGLSSPWLQSAPEEVSGFGCELMIKSPVEAEWPGRILRSMAFYLFNHAGTLSPGARIGLNGPIVADTDSKVRNLVIWYADEAPDCWYQLPSGGFGIFAAIGITDDELQFAESIDEYGTWCIQQVLRQIGSAQVTDPNRQSVMNHDDISSITASVASFARQFKASSNTFGGM